MDGRVENYTYPVVMNKLSIFHFVTLSYPGFSDALLPTILEVEVSFSSFTNFSSWIRASIEL